MICIDETVEIARNLREDYAVGSEAQYINRQHHWYHTTGILKSIIEECFQATCLSIYANFFVIC